MKLTNVLAPDHLDRLLWHAEFFQVPTKERWKTFRARHIINFSKESSKLKLYSGLSFDCQTNFRLGAFALWFHFQWKAFVKCYCLCEPIKSFFFFCDACQMTVNWLVLHLFLVPQNRKPYNKHLTSFPFTVHAVNYSLTHTLTWLPEGGQPLDLSTASYQPSVQQSHLLRMPQYPS